MNMKDLALFDDFIRPRQHLLRYRQADLLGCFQIDNPTVFSLPIPALRSCLYLRAIRCVLSAISLLLLVALVQIIGKATFV
jgi:hypothetical protein